MALTKITGGTIADGTVVASDIADDSISIPKLSATGTADATTYLRGDDTWATVVDTDTTYTASGVLSIDGANNITSTAEANAADTAITTADNAWTGSQRATLVVDNDLSFDMNLGQKFKATPAGAGTLTFTNITNGQSGIVWLVNTGGHAISKAGTVLADANFLTTVSTAGTYLVHYESDGTNVIVTNSGAVS